MLDAAEKEKRLEFYTGIFGNKRIPSLWKHLWPIQNYDEKIKGLQERGFEDPQKMIVKLPAILGLSLNNIDEKIKGCRNVDLRIHRR